MSENSENKVPENLFVYRMMCARCSYGNMTHPLNVKEVNGGHGILFGPDKQPVLNANDWVPDVNVIHFGDCVPKVDTDQYSAFTKFFLDLFSFGVTQKCKPQIDKVWFDTDEKYTIDGAPVLLARSVLFCKKGGVIRIEIPVVEEDDAAEQKAAEPKTPEQKAADMAAAQAETDAAVDAALEAGKIDQETAEFMKEGYASALQFADGDIERANNLFSDLTRQGSLDAGGQDSFSYSSSEGDYEKFQLYLEHTGSKVSNTKTNQMQLSGNSGNIGLSDALQTSVMNEQRVAAAPRDDEGNPKEPVSLGGYIDDAWSFAQEEYEYRRSVYGPQVEGPGPAPGAGSSNMLSFMKEEDIPEPLQGANLSQTAVSISDQITANPDKPIVASIIDGLG